MELKRKEVDVYIAKDGKEFLEEKECKHHEDSVLSKLEKIRYFRYLTGKDLNETGLFFHQNYAAVYHRGHLHSEILMQYLIDQNNGCILSVGIQGCGETTCFEIYEISEELYFEAEPNKWGGQCTETEQIFISEEPIEGFPKNIKVISKHIKR